MPRSFLEDGRLIWHLPQLCENSLSNLTSDRTKPRKVPYCNSRRWNCNYSNLPQGSLVANWLHRQVRSQVVQGVQARWNLVAQAKCYRWGAPRASALCPAARGDVLTSSSSDRGGNKAAGPRCFNRKCYRINHSRRQCVPWSCDVRIGWSDHCCQRIRIDGSVWLGRRRAQSTSWT